MKNFYFVVNVKENDKLYAYVAKATEKDELLSKFKIKNVISVNIFPTKKRADEIAKFWNECYKKNGTYLFYGGILI